MLTNLYLQTTDPRLTVGQLMQGNILVGMILSILLHTIIYASFFNLASYIFFGKLLSNIVNARLISSLILIMIMGFYGRFIYVKDIYSAYNYDIQKAREHVDKFFISWVFLT
jgi:hypothetical protein